MTLRFGSLFSGIGGFDLGLERAGMECAWQVEIDPKCREILENHWPEVRRYPDIKTVEWSEVEHVDLICGGFPCPVVSCAARGRNVGEWLWPEFYRAIRGVRPRWVLLENVEGLRYRGRGFGEILGDLAECGFDAEWEVLPASAFGAPHRRARLWLVAHTNGNCESNLPVDDEVAELPKLGSFIRGWPDPPKDIRVDDGIPDRVDRIRALGNAVVPQVAEWIGRRIIGGSRASAPRLRSPEER